MANLFNEETPKIIPQKKAKDKIDPKVKSFNSLLKSIEKLEQDKVKTEILFDKLYFYHHANIEPLTKTGHDLHLALVKVLFNAVPRMKLNNKDQNKITNLMTKIMEDISTSMPLDEESKQIYNAISPLNHNEFIEDEIVTAKLQIANMVGIVANKIDWQKYDLLKFMHGSISEKNDFLYQLFSDLSNNPQSTIYNESNKEKKVKENKKNKIGKKEEEKIVKEKEKEEFESKSLKSLYNSLAKILHPDLEQDKLLKVEKEEWMKRLTTAYKNKDLATMIQIEIYWLKEGKFNPITADEEKFKVYIKFLKERKETLEMEIDYISMHPKYMPILAFTFLDSNQAMNLIAEEFENIKTHQKNVLSLTELLLNPNPKLAKVKKKELKIFLKENSEDLPDFFDDDLFW